MSELERILLTDPDSEEALRHEAFVKAIEESGINYDDYASDRLSPRKKSKAYMIGVEGYLEYDPEADKESLRNRIMARNAEILGMLDEEPEIGGNND